MKALEIKDLYKSFRSNFFIKQYKILEKINIDVEQGEIYGFLGPNGAVKTTTIKCVLDLLTPDSGEISIFGFPSTTIQSREKIGFLPENPYFYEYLTAKELLTFTGMLFSMPKKQINDKVNELIKRIGLEGIGNLKIKKFSKGMIQRIGIAQALIHNPDLVILDEPFSGIDPIGRKQLRDIIISLRDSGKTIFFSSHILQDMELMVDRVGIILDGKIVKEGKLTNLISRSVESYEIVFTGINEKKLKEKKHKFAVQDKKYIIKTNSNRNVNKIVKFITDEKGKVLSVTPEKMTLEDIFLREIK